MRVVLLTKQHSLSEHLERALEQAGCLAGVIHERRLETVVERARYARKWAKRQGWLRTLDVVAYELYERVARRGDLARAARLLPFAASPRRTTDVPRQEVASLNTAASRALIASWAPDLLIVHATGILKPETFQLAGVAAINLHCGVLPEYRGHASSFWSFSNGDWGNVGVTIHLVADRVDTGGILRVGRVAVQPGDDDITLWYKSFLLGTELVLDVVRSLDRGEDLEILTVPGAMGPHYPRKGLTDYLRLRARTLFRPRQRHAPAIAERSRHA